jgi:hypothetical protein
MNRDDFLHKELCLMNAKCPCGGWYNDFHSHASDCIVINDDGVAYKWSPDKENPTLRNKKRRHDIKGKLTPVYTLAQVVDNNGISDERFHGIIISTAKQSMIAIPQIIEALDAIE